jgi:hypothetical protein
VTDFLNLLRRYNISAAALAASVIATGRALQISNGTYDLDALWWIAVGFALCITGVALHRAAGSWSPVGLKVTSLLLAAGIGWQLWQLSNAPPAMHIPPTTSLLPFRIGVIALGILSLAGLLDLAVTRRYWFPLVIATSLALGLWVIRVSPTPGIDVVVVHNEALKALLEGNDPYRISFPNIYGDAWRYYYNPSVVVGDRIAFGYPYPPASLLLAMPGYVLLGDYRYSLLALLTGAALLIGYSRSHLAAKLAAVALLTTPRGFFVLEQGWTEPLTIFLVALTVSQLRKGPLKAAWAAGLMLAAKQYLPFIGLSVLRTLWLDRARWYWTAGIIALVGLLCVVPFALWHINSFMRSVVWLQTLEPFRTDALSFLIWADRNGWGRGTFIWAVGAAAVAAGLSLVATKNTPSGLATSSAFIMFAMFVFGSKAFCNYYYFVIGALCIAIAALPGPGEADVRLR